MTTTQGRGALGSALFSCVEWADSSSCLSALTLGGGTVQWISAGLSPSTALVDLCQQFQLKYMLLQMDMWKLITQAYTCGTSGICSTHVVILCIFSLLTWSLVFHWTGHILQVLEVFPMPKMSLLILYLISYQCELVREKMSSRSYSGTKAHGLHLLGPCERMRIYPQSVFSEFLLWGCYHILSDQEDSSKTLKLHLYCETRFEGQKHLNNCSVYRMWPVQRPYHEGKSD